ncbi:MAG: hypothetical protein Q4B65_00145 [Candidatus Saccharibacteria bacterium]|nr:hypothetical protein [Candidatus Saccharibacteria bacterium]
MISDGETFLPGKSEEANNPKPQRKQKRDDRKILTAVLAGLVVLIIGFVVAILVVNLTRGGEGTEVEDGSWGGVSELTPEQEILADVQSELERLPASGVQGYLDEKIAESEEELEVKISLTLLKAQSQVEAGNANCALNTLWTLDIGELSGKDLMTYYNIGWTAYDELGDIENRESYEELYDQAYTEYYSNFTGGAGGD